MNILFALNIFIVVLLLGRRPTLVIPRQLQPIGRASPAGIAFPDSDIVAGYADGVLRLVQVSIRQREILPDAFYYYSIAFRSSLLSNHRHYGFVLLPENSGYRWQRYPMAIKWFGVSIVFVSFCYLLLRDKTWYNTTIARSGSVVLAFCLLAGGHYGASITAWRQFFTGARNGL